MMDYEIFKEVVKEKILDYLPPAYQNSEVILRQVNKFNKTVPEDGMVVAKPGENVCPIVYLNRMYKDYQLTNDIDLIMRGTAEIVMDAYIQAKENKLEADYSIKDHIVPELSNTVVNAERLKDSPTRQFNDLTVSYKVILGEGDGKTASIHITNNYAEELGMTENQLYELACENMKRMYPADTTRLTDYIYGSLKEKGLSDDEIQYAMGGSIQDYQESSPWIVKNNSVNGAMVLLDTDVLDDLANYVGGNLVIIPSSIYEVLALDANMIPDCEDLSAFINEVNMTEVKPEERLSNQVYLYDREDKQVKMITNSQNLSVVPEQSKILTFERKENRPGL